MPSPIYRGRRRIRCHSVLSSPACRARIGRGRWPCADHGLFCLTLFSVRLSVKESHFFHQRINRGYDQSLRDLRRC